VATMLLIVDDDTGILETLSDVLEARGHRVAVASNGPAALEQARREPFDLALIDIVMPGMNGVELCQQLKRLSPGTVIIMMTAYSMEELVRQALTAGAHRVLYKPLDLDIVFNLVESARGSATMPGAAEGPASRSTDADCGGRCKQLFEGGEDG